MSLEQISFRAGSKGRNTYSAEITLVSGTATITTNMTRIDHVQITQKGATAVADGMAWSASGKDLTIVSSNASSAETYSVLAIGI